MEAIRLETTVRHDGTINVPGVKAGQDVEVIVLFKPTGVKSYPLRGTAGVYRYHSIRRYTKEIGKDFSLLDEILVPAADAIEK